MKHLIILALGTLLFSSCATVVFTTKPELGERHHGKIPAEWQGRWKGEDNMFFYITADTVQHGGSPFSYYISDSLKGDFIYFRENYCFIVKKHPVDTTRMTLTMARINEKKEIECFDMNYDYFLKKQLITSVYAKQFYYAEDTSNAYGFPNPNVKLEQREVNIVLPCTLLPRNENNSAKKDYELILKNKNYKKYLRNLNISNSGFITAYYYDFSFFKKFADECRPDVILRQDKTMQSSGASHQQKRYERLFKKDAKHDLKRLLKKEL
jgi:hypothetical protein